MQSIKKLALFCLCSAGVLSVNAATHYLVPPGTIGAAPLNPYTSWETAGTSVFDVVKAAMTNATLPRIILTTNGVYVLTNTITLTNDVVLKGVNGRDVTIFDGNAKWHFVMNHTNCVLDGLTITNGWSNINGIDAFGGGIQLRGGTVTNCLITGCLNDPRAPNDASGGGGIWMGGIGVVANSIIRGNVNTNAGGGGGGIRIRSGTNLVVNCVIEMNHNQTQHGGGMSIDPANDDVTIRNCLIRYNRSGLNYGGGMLIGETNTHVINCTIVSNYSASASGVSLAVSFTNMLINCIVYSNKDSNVGGYAANKFSSFAFSCSYPANNFFSLTGTSNTTNDPGFIDFMGENYRFNRYSPCFNSGTNQPDWMSDATDLDGHPRILHDVVDMGAYELFIPGGTMFRLR